MAMSSVKVGCLASARAALRPTTSVVTQRDGSRTERVLADGSEAVISELPPSTKVLSTAPMSPPPPIPRRALALVDDPTRAWDIVKVSQQACTLPLERFTHPEPQAPGTVRFVVISDTHSAEARRGPPVVVPDGDVLLHCGDFSQTGRLEEVESFCRWFGALPHRRKILIAGNHDLSLHGKSYAETAARFGHQVTDTAAVSAKARALVAAIPRCEYLCDSGTSVRGVRVWGSPWQPWFHDWAFNLPRGEPCRDKWRLVPEGTDVVLTHGPALGHGDLCSSGLRAGCLDLLDELQSRVKPRFHCFGHIHEGFGATTDGATTYLNASTCTLRYRADNPALIFDLPASDDVDEMPGGGCSGPIPSETLE